MFSQKNTGSSCQLPFSVAVVEVMRETGDFHESQLRY